MGAHPFRGEGTTEQFVRMLWKDVTDGVGERLGMCSGRVGDDRPLQSDVTWLPLGCAGFHGSTLAGRWSLQKSLEQIVAVSHTEFVVDQNDAVLDNLACRPELSRDFLALFTFHQQGRYISLFLR